MANLSKLDLTGLAQTSHNYANWSLPELHVLPIELQEA